MKIYHSSLLVVGIEKSHISLRPQLSALYKSNKTKYICCHSTESKEEKTRNERTKESYGESAGPLSTGDLVSPVLDHRPTNSSDMRDGRGMSGKLSWMLRDNGCLEIDQRPFSGVSATKVWVDWNEAVKMDIYIDCIPPPP